MITGILLAGGSATRFGSAKLLHPYKEGATIGEVAAKNLLAGTGSVLAVVRAGDDELAYRLRAAGCDVLSTPRSRDGIGASLAAGVEAASGAEGWLIALADMPAIDPETIRAVANALRKGAVLAAPVLRASGERGHPVGFSAAFKAELLALSTDEGARTILARHPGMLVAVPVEDRGILLDIDRPGDLAPEA